VDLRNIIHMDIIFLGSELGFFPSNLWISFFFVRVGNFSNLRLSVNRGMVVRCVIKLLLDGASLICSYVFTLLYLAHHVKEH
jgi:uncharacterized ion transporter superfamily protein YfcC